MIGSRFVYFVRSYCLLFVCFFISQSVSFNDSSLPNKPFTLFDLPVYWINADNMPEKRTFMETHLTSLSIKHHQRITALTPETCPLFLYEDKCERITFTDIAHLCSHFSALYQAIHDPHPLAKDSPYFLVIEDTVQFKLNLNLHELLAEIPSFGSIQLMVNTIHDLESLWINYQVKGYSHAFEPRYRNSTITSSQAILYNRSLISSFIEKATQRDVSLKRFLGYKIASTNDYRKTPITQYNAIKPTIACACGFSDYFLYAMAQPSYILTIPVMNSLSTGLTHIKQQKLLHTIQAYAFIDDLHHRLQVHSLMKPKIYAMIANTTKEYYDTVDWQSFSLQYQLTLHGQNTDTIRENKVES